MKSQSKAASVGGHMHFNEKAAPLGPIAYSLCQKPVIGHAMWITGLCAFWPPIPDTEISIQDTGLALNKEFSAPVTKSYLLTLRFVFRQRKFVLKMSLWVTDTPVASVLATSSMTLFRNESAEAWGFLFRSKSLCAQTRKEHR